MKKLSLSFGLIIVFAFYAMLSSSRNATTSVATISSNTPTSQTVTTPKPPLTTKTPSSTIARNITKTLATSVTPIAISTPKPISTNPANTASKYRDGTYTGPVADAYYGNVQVSATISGGKLTDVAFLDYPNDRNNSVRINTHAMPLLTTEAITAQSASVDGVSGATATSGAFRESLGAALAQAAN